jgi:hypothetical protein
MIEKEQDMRKLIRATLCSNISKSIDNKMCSPFMKKSLNKSFTTTLAKRILPNRDIEM